jgi:carbamoyl-phosphate synthase small subunit
VSKLFPATLVLENGLVYTGQSFGAQTDAVFELVFNTSMMGYQEIISDPSYKGQGVLFTVSHIGNVGINPEDNESGKPQVSAVIARTISPVVSNWRSTNDISTWLDAYGIPGIAGIDTRAITRQLREIGTMRAALSTRGTSSDNLLASVLAWPGLDGLDMVKEVTCPKAYQWYGDSGDKWLGMDGGLLEQSNSPEFAGRVNTHVVLIDFGAKRNILRHLAWLGARVTVVPASTSAQTILAMTPDGVMLSNGPGDPAGLVYAIKTVNDLLDTEMPIFGICLGHQLIGLALGAQTSRLKFGHHAGNHPVKNIQTGKVYITAQNHNYMVLPESLNSDEVEVTHLSLNDGSLEGMRMKHKPVYSVQFHPESAPGPHDAHELFTSFFESMWARKTEPTENKND